MKKLTGKYISKLLVIVFLIMPPVKTGKKPMAGDYETAIQADLTYTFY